MSSQIRSRSLWKQRNAQTALAMSSCRMGRERLSIAVCLYSTTSLTTRTWPAERLPRDVMRPFGVATRNADKKSLTTWTTSEVMLS